MTTSNPTAARLRSNLASVRARIADACRRSGRQPQAVRLVAVTKYVGLDVVRALLACRQRDLGENRVQQLLERETALGGCAGLLDQDDAPGETRPRWHMIGHLQRNKVRKLIERVRIIHAIDSERLADEIERRAGESGVRIDGLIEVNTSGEASKYGVAPDALDALAARLANFQHLTLRGLMTMAPVVRQPEQARPFFARLRELLGGLGERGVVGAGCDQLSMGMSGDFEVAVEEGATLVRIGSLLYEGL